MIPIPSGVKVWIATGVTDMRRTHQNPELLQGSDLDSDVRVYDLAQGFDAAPRVPSDQAEKAALEKASKVLGKSKSNGPISSS